MKWSVVILILLGLVAAASASVLVASLTAGPQPLMPVAVQVPKDVEILVAKKEKVESKSKTQRHVFSHFLEASGVEYAMEGREEEATKEEEDPEAWFVQAFDVRDSR